MPPPEWGFVRYWGMVSNMLNDCLTTDLRLVVCGTAASAVSAARGQYYAGPGNRFWQTLHAIGLAPRQLAPAEYELLPTFGIGLTDVVKGQSGMDREIDFRGSDRAGFLRKIEWFQPLILCFNGKKAAETCLNRKSPAFGFQVECIGKTRLYVAPSTSGAASGFWDLGVWHALAVAISTCAPSHTAAQGTAPPSPTPRR
jgi:TDG/mug DNA glycosylase family protein